MRIFFRLREWCHRLGRAKGFGIQSPTDFRFVREVIGERCPYYAYQDIQRLLSHESKMTNKLGLLYFRVANHFQPDVIAGVGMPLMTQVMSMGCRKARRVDADSVAQVAEAGAGVRLLLLDHGDVRHVNGILPMLAQGSVVIVQDIYHDVPAQQAWQEFLEKGENIVVFDIYHCGIVVKAENRYKQIYKINF